MSEIFSIPEIIVDIFINLSKKDLSNATLISKSINKVVTSQYFKQQWKERNLPKFEKLDLGGRQGWTDYIDFIRVDEFNRLATGVDINGRSFICIKCVGEFGNTLVEFAQTFFQRYTDNNDLWMGARINGGMQFLSTEGGTRKEEFEFLDKLIKGEVVETHPTRFMYDYHGIKNIRLKGY